jgi:hypothetical protein
MITAQQTAEKLWNSLTNNERWELGDALVLSTFAWEDYWESKPPVGTLRELDKLRMWWESSVN